MDHMILDFAMMIPNLWSFLWGNTRVTVDSGLTSEESRIWKRNPPSCVTWEAKL